MVLAVSDRTAVAVRCLTTCVTLDGAWVGICVSILVLRFCLLSIALFRQQPEGFRVQGKYLHIEKKVAAAAILLLLHYTSKMTC